MSAEQDNSFISLLLKNEFPSIRTYLNPFLRINDNELRRDFEQFSLLKRSHLVILVVAIVFSFIVLPIEIAIQSSLNSTGLDSYRYYFQIAYLINIIMFCISSWLLLSMKSFPQLRKYDWLISTMFIGFASSVNVLRLIRYVFDCNENSTPLQSGWSCRLEDTAKITWTSGTYLMAPCYVFICILKETRTHLVLIYLLSSGITMGFLLDKNQSYDYIPLAILMIINIIFIFELQYQNLSTYFLNRKLIETMVEKENMIGESTANEMRHLIANVAHDLKTPLSSFVSGIDLIENVILECEDNFKNDTVTITMLYEKMGVVGQYLEDIRNTNTFMMMTINRCIDYTKAIKGVKLIPRYETIDLIETIKLPLKCMKNIQNRIDIVLKPWDPNDICQYIVTDKLWLQENILCLLSNAVKYSYSGVITITISKQSSFIPDETHEGTSTQMKLKLVSNESQYMSRSARSLIDSSRDSLETLCFEIPNYQKPNLYAVPTVDLNNQMANEYDADKKTVKFNVADNNTFSFDHYSEMHHSTKNNLSLTGDNFASKSFHDMTSSNSGSPTPQSSEGQQNSPCKPPNCYLRFEVEDTGIGMTEEAMKSLFGAFKQTQRLAGGTGLGLYSLAKRIEALKGFYGVMKRRDGLQGSIFWFLIPYQPDLITASIFTKDHIVPDVSMNFLLEDTSKAHDSLKTLTEKTSLPLYPASTIALPESLQIETENEANISPPKVPSFEKTPFINDILHANSSGKYGTPSAIDHLQFDILIVDDSPSILKLTSIMLRRQGHNIHLAENGAVALKMIDEKWTTKQTVFDVVLMDLQMPIMDGLEATRRMRLLEEESHRNRDNRPRTLIVGCSANSDYETIDEAIAAGIDTFMSKPFTMDSFMKMCKQNVTKLRDHKPATMFHI